MRHRLAISGEAVVNVLCCVMVAIIGQSLLHMRTELDAQRQINSKLVQQVAELHAHVRQLNSALPTAVSGSSGAQQERRLEDSSGTSPSSNDTFVWINATPSTLKMGSGDGAVSMLHSKAGSVHITATTLELGASSSSLSLVRPTAAEPPLTFFPLDSSKTLDPAQAQQAGLPINGDAHYSKMQFLYTTADLTAQGFAAGSRISAIAIKCLSPPGRGMSSLTISYALTSSDALSSFVAVKQVHGPTNYPASSFIANSWFEFALSSPVEWDGLRNIAFEIAEDNSASNTHVAGGGVAMVMAGVSSSVFNEVKADAKTGVEVDVQITDFKFPATTEIDAGDTVKWTNAHSGLVHTVESLDPVTTFNSQHLTPSNSFSFTFTYAGSYKYRCAVHSTAPWYMNGTIVVRPKLKTFAYVPHLRVRSSSPGAPTSIVGQQGTAGQIGGDVVIEAGVGGSSGQPSGVVRIGRKADKVTIGGDLTVPALKCQSLSRLEEMLTQFRCPEGNYVKDFACVQCGNCAEAGKRLVNCGGYKGMIGNSTYAPHAVDVTSNGTCAACTEYLDENKGVTAELPKHAHVVASSGNAYAQRCPWKCDHNYILWENKTGCKMGCLAGEYYDSGSGGVCTKCAAGRYGDEGGLTAASQCKTCPAGKYGDVAGLTACKAVTSTSWKITSGSSYCSIIKEGSSYCVTDGAGNYGNGENCAFEFNGAATVRRVEWGTEACCDYVQVNGGTSYKGDVGASTAFPSTMAISGRTTFAWRTDGSNVAVGFKLCV